MPLSRNGLPSSIRAHSRSGTAVPIPLGRSRTTGTAGTGEIQMNIRKPIGHARRAAACVLLLALTMAAARTSGSAAGGSDAGSGAPRNVSWTEYTMGTYGRVTLVTGDSAAAWDEAAIALAALRRIDSLMSNWTTTSEVARLNREAGTKETRVHPEVGRVLEASLALWKESGGAYDITVEPLVRAWGFLGGPRRVPSEAEIHQALAHVGAQRVHYSRETGMLRFDDPATRIDLGGIAKGYAVDVAAESLTAHGVRNALVDLSGNMFAIGSPPGASGWRIGVRDPRDRIPYLARLAIHNEGISTSGQYQQFVAVNGRTYGHIMDPRTGWPVQGLIAVTVVSPSAMECDGWDTPLFVMGLDPARRRAKALGDLSAILIQPGAGSVDTMWVEETLRDRLILEPAARPFIQVRYF
jgi:FAD:protein FMN transferase